MPGHSLRQYLDHLERRLAFALWAVQLIISSVITGLYLGLSTDSKKSLLIIIIWVAVNTLTPIYMVLISLIRHRIIRWIDDRDEFLEDKDSNLPT